MALFTQAHSEMGSFTEQGCLKITTGTPMRGSGIEIWHRGTAYVRRLMVRGMRVSGRRICITAKANRNSMTAVHLMGIIRSA